MKVLSFGEILWDVYPDGKSLGGAPLNFAAHLARHGEDAYMLSSIGDDKLGNEALEKISAWGVHRDYITVSSLPTGVCIVTLDELGVPAYDLKRGVAYDDIKFSGDIGNFDVLYFGTLAQRSENNREVLKCLVKSGIFREIFVDVNIRAPYYSDESVLFSIESATILKVSLEELDEVAGITKISYGSYGELAKELVSRYKNIKCIIITLGGDGAYLYDDKTKLDFTCPAIDTKVVSTVGAGDSFSAAFLHKYMRGNLPVDCLKYAARIAGLVVSSAEAVPVYDVEM